MRLDSGFSFATTLINLTSIITGLWGTPPNSSKLCCRTFPGLRMSSSPLKNIWITQKSWNWILEARKNGQKILARLQRRYKYILVDEFQDTNLAQYELLKLLAAPDNNITVVGDDDQSIFKFRGASISNIIHFQKDYPEGKFISLTDNYRSGQKILDSAYDFIQANNPDRLEIKLKLSKKLKSQTTSPGQILHLEDR